VILQILLDIVLWMAAVGMLIFIFAWIAERDA
jgi:hypothetical protein